jgi:hypothetical protein
VDSDPVGGGPRYLATDSLKDPHREFWAVAHGQAIHPTIIAPRLDLTDLDSRILESNQHARNTTMPVGCANREMTVPAVDRQHW